MGNNNERLSNRDRETSEAQSTLKLNMHTEIIRRGLAEIALRVQSGGVRVWQDRALCSASIVDTTIFEPSRHDKATLKIAEQYCANCDVRNQCERYVKGRSGGGMVWAGRRKE